MFLKLITQIITILVNEYYTFVFFIPRPIKICVIIGIFNMYYDLTNIYHVNI